MRAGESRPRNRLSITSTIRIFPRRDSDEDVGFGWLRRGSDEFSKRMQALASASFFLDLRHPALQNELAFTGEQHVPVESRVVRLRLLASTDAIVWLKHVRPPALPLPQLLILGGMHYRLTLAGVRGAVRGRCDGRRLAPAK
jgi:hypothetical protein